MQLSLKRDHSQQNRSGPRDRVLHALSPANVWIPACQWFLECRSALTQQGVQASSPARETDRTAELDNQGILQMQQDVMQEQDQNLEAMEQSVASTRVR